MSNNTRQILLNVARELIDSEGIDQLSMRVVGKQAGLSHTALYRHFKSKESLLAALVQENFIKLGKGISMLSKSHDNGKESLLNALKLYFQFALSQPDHYRLMFNTRWNEESYPALKEAGEEVFFLVSQFVYQSLPPSERAPQSVKRKTAIIYAFAHGLVELHLSGHNQPSKGMDRPEALMEEMVNSLIVS